MTTDVFGTYTRMLTSGWYECRGPAGARRYEAAQWISQLRPAACV